MKRTNKFQMITEREFFLNDKKSNRPNKNEPWYELKKPQKIERRILRGKNQRNDTNSRLKFEQIELKSKKNKFMKNTQLYTQLPRKISIVANFDICSALRLTVFRELKSHLLPAFVLFGFQNCEQKNYNKQ